MTEKQIFYEDNKPYIFEGVNRAGESRRRFGQIKSCKECGTEFFTCRNKDFCSNHCSMRHEEVKSTKEIFGDVVYFTDTGCFIKYKEGNYLRKRRGEVKTCKYCGKDFFTSYGCNFCSKVCAHSKENHYNWKGGHNSLPVLIRADPKYYQWRNAVYERDGFSCQICKKISDHDLVAHHAIPMNRIITKHNLRTLKEAIGCMELWEVENGITLCESCHRTHHKAWGY